MAIDLKAQVDFNKLPFKNGVAENCTSLTRPANPVGGQLIYETDTGLFKHYNALKDRWESASTGIVFKGIVGGSSTGALINLPTTDVLIGDMYLVGADGDYGPSGSTQHATKGDKFIATTESTTTTPPTWLLFDDNTKVAGDITIADGTTTYTIPNLTGSTDLVVDVYKVDSTNNKVVEVKTGIEITTANISVIIGSPVATAEDGETYRVVASNG